MLATLFGLFIAPDLVGGLWNHGIHRNGLMVLVDWDEGEVGGKDMLLGKSAKIFGQDLDPDFHRCAPGSVDRGFAD
jgi:hypothetical protein